MATREIMTMRDNWRERMALAATVALLAAITCGCGGAEYASRVKAAEQKLLDAESVRLRAEIGDRQVGQRPDRQPAAGDAAAPADGAANDTQEQGSGVIPALRQRQRGLADGTAAEGEPSNDAAEPMP